ncbi:MAG: hypothetical protein JJU29_15170 [Verrucomicrobia bacterium]|nr:hypothetical protein [Verrucomicrobiota bacterium]MCH8512444.1 hypothetical protein [Kiritimatiellia bacterium]
MTVFTRKTRHPKLGNPLYTVSFFAFLWFLELGFYLLFCIDILPIYTVSFFTISVAMNKEHEPGPWLAYLILLPTFFLWLGSLSTSRGGTNPFFLMAWVPIITSWPILYCAKSPRQQDAEKRQHESLLKKVAMLEGTTRNPEIDQAICKNCAHMETRELYTGIDEITCTAFSKKPYPDIQTCIHFTPKKETIEFEKTSPDPSAEKETD